MKEHAERKYFYQGAVQLLTRSQLGAGAIEYSLVLGVITLLIVGASTTMKSGLDGFFTQTVDCVSDVISSNSNNGCASSVNSSSTRNSQDSGFTEGEESQNIQNQSLSNAGSVENQSTIEESPSSQSRVPIPFSSRAVSNNESSADSNNGVNASSVASESNSNSRNSNLAAIPNFNNVATRAHLEECDAESSESNCTESNDSESENINDSLSAVNTDTASESVDGDTDRRANAENDREDRRTDRREDARIETDRRWRREEGGDGSNGHFSNDWAGRSILDRYLTGGGDWHIDNDSDWTEYMQANPTLTSDLRDRAIESAESLHQSGNDSGGINENYHTSIENGEGIIGYQYLHGTNGGFDRIGSTEIERHSDGSSTVTLEMEYTWNDVIDPNPEYQTDRWKSRVAEGITLGRADPYEISISWTEITVVELDANGNATNISNQ